jgi:hypothetical protein
LALDKNKEMRYNKEGVIRLYKNRRYYMKLMIKALSLILSALMIFILPSCLDRSGTNPGGASDKESEALTDNASPVTTEPPFDASAYTYTPSLKDESEMEFGIIIAGDVIVEIAKYVAEAPQFSEAGALRYLGDAKKAHAVIDGYYDYEIIRIYGNKLPVVRYSEDLTVRISEDMNVTGIYYYKVMGWKGYDPIWEKYSEMPEEKGEYYLVVKANHNGEYGEFKMQYFAKIING